MFKKKRWAASLAAVAMAVMMSCGAATPAFAYYDESAASESTESAVEVEETIEETTDAAEETTDDGETDDTRDVSGALTPDGSLTLVDDLDEDESEAMQFMTVTTRDGSYYYIIIDRSGTSENVYFLNAVDTVDLMNLMSDDEKAEFTGEEEETTETVLTPTVIDDQTEEEDVDNNETVTEEKSNNSSLIMLGVFGVIGILIAGAYYMLKIKPKKGQGSIDEDREFYDDEEYENEDEVATEDEFEEDEE